MKRAGRVVRLLRSCVPRMRLVWTHCGWWMVCGVRQRVRCFRNMTRTYTMWMCVENTSVSRVSGIGHATGGHNVAAGLYVKVNAQEHYLFKEIYRKHESLNEVIDKMRAIERLYNIPRIENLICDHEGTSVNLVKEAGYNCELTDKREGVASSIEVIRYALANGIIKFNINSLDDPEPLLVGRSRRLTQEVSMIEYKQDDKMTGSKEDDLPSNDFPRHAIDHLRYYSVYNISRTPIEPSLSIPLIIPIRGDSDILFGDNNLSIF